MEEVLHYLDLKNRYYEKFITLTERFLAEARAEQWDRLPEVADSRERILHILRSFDFKIANLFEDLDLGTFDLEAYRDRVHSHFTRREELVQRIVALDLELIGRLDELKTEALKDLRQRVEAGLSERGDVVAPSTARKPVSEGRS
jgi:hypothetical protein